MCKEIQKTLSYRILNSLILSPTMDPEIRADLENEAVLALQKCVTANPPSFSSMVWQAEIVIKTCNWDQGVPVQQLKTLDELLRRLSFIGCSEISFMLGPMSHFVILSSSLLRLLDIMFRKGSDFRAKTVVLTGIYSVMLNFDDACSTKFDLSAQASQFSDGWWDEISRKHSKAVGAPFSEKWWEETRDKYGWTRIVDRPSHMGLTGIDLLDDASDASENVAGRNLLGDASGAFEKPAEGILLEPLRSKGSPARPQVLREFLKLSLFIIVELYRQAVNFDPASGGRQEGRRLSVGFKARQKDEETRSLEDQYLHKLASMATFVLRHLSESDQNVINLPEQVYLLWSEAEMTSPTWRDYDDGRTNILSLGVLRALWPGALLRKVQIQTPCLRRQLNISSL